MCFSIQSCISPLKVSKTFVFVSKNTSGWRWSLNLTFKQEIKPCATENSICNSYWTTKLQMWICSLKHPHCLYSSNHPIIYQIIIKWVLLQRINTLLSRAISLKWTDVKHIPKLVQIKVSVVIDVHIPNIICWWICLDRSTAIGWFTYQPHIYMQPNKCLCPLKIHMLKS